MNSVTLGDYYAISPRLLNAFHGTFTRRGETRGNSTSLISTNDLGINVYAPVANDLHVAVTNDFSLGCGTCATARYGITTFELADDFEIVKGRITSASAAACCGPITTSMPPTMRTASSPSMAG